jgi:hypothetical protein
MVASPRLSRLTIGRNISASCWTEQKQRVNDLELIQRVRIKEEEKRERRRLQNDKRAENLKGLLATLN